MYARALPVFVSSNPNKGLHGRLPDRYIDSPNGTRRYYYGDITNPNLGPSQVRRSSVAYLGDPRRHYGAIGSSSPVQPKVVVAKHRCDSRVSLLHAGEESAAFGRHPSRVYFAVPISALVLELGSCGVATVAPYHGFQELGDEGGNIIDFIMVAPTLGFFFGSLMLILVARQKIRQQSSSSRPCWIIVLSTFAWSITILIAILVLERAYAYRISTVAMWAALVGNAAGYWLVVLRPDNPAPSPAVEASEDQCSENFSPNGRRASSLKFSCTPTNNPGRLGRAVSFGARRSSRAHKAQLEDVRDIYSNLERSRAGWHLAPVGLNL